MPVQLLRQKLPDILLWIDRTLALHHPKAQLVSTRHFSRLSRYYPAEILNSSYVIIVPHIPIPPLTALGLHQFAEFEKGNYSGITYKNTYFVQINAAHDESIHFHELVHVAQWQFLGPERFLMEYARGYLEAGGYRNNPLEIIAYNLQEKFDNNAPPFDAVAMVRRNLHSTRPGN